MSTTILDKTEKLSKTPNPWDKAISDAQELIKEAEAEIVRLKQSIQLFGELKRKGAKFPGEVKNDAAQ